MFLRPLKQVASNDQRRRWTAEDVRQQSSTDVTAQLSSAAAVHLDYMYEYDITVLHHVTCRQLHLSSPHMAYNCEYITYRCQVRALMYDVSAHDSHESMRLDKCKCHRLYVQASFSGELFYRNHNVTTQLHNTTVEPSALNSQTKSNDRRFRSPANGGILLPMATPQCGLISMIRC